MIKEISLEGFLSYGQKMSVSLNALNIIVGFNGSGKSNLIESIDLMHNAPVELTKSIREGGGVVDWLWKGNGGIPVATVDAVFDYAMRSANLRYALSFSANQQRFEIRDERIENEVAVDSSHSSPYFYYRFNDGRPYIIVYDEGSDFPRQRTLKNEDVDFEKSILSQRKDPDMYPEITWIGNQLQKIQIYRNWSFGRYTPPRLPQKADLQNSYLEPDCSNLGLILNRLSLQSSVKSDICKYLNDVNSNINDFSVFVEGGTVQVFVQEGKMSIPATRLSDGTLRFLCLLAMLCNTTMPPLICIEEPELGLHPDIIPTLARLLKKASEKTQLIVTTHSSILVDCFTETPEDVIVADKEKGGTQLRRLSRDELKPWLKNYSLGNIWLQGEFGGTRW